MMTVNMMEGRMTEGCYCGTPQDKQTWRVSFLAGMLGVRSQLQQYTGLMKQAGSGTERKTQQCQRLVPAPEGPFCYYPQSGLTAPHENVGYCLLLCHFSRIQPSFWVAASSDPAEDADIPVSAVSESRPTPASLPWLSADLCGVACIFPWRRSIDQSQFFAEADNGVWKDLHYLLCCLEAGAPFLPGL